MGSRRRAPHGACELKCCRTIGSRTPARSPYTPARFLGVGANSRAIYVERQDQPLFTRTNILREPKKAQKVWVFRIEKVPTNGIIS